MSGPFKVLIAIVLALSVVIWWSLPTASSYPSDTHAVSCEATGWWSGC